jgi:hypothetical protein
VNLLTFPWPEAKCSAPRKVDNSKHSKCSIVVVFFQNCETKNVRIDILNLGSNPSDHLPTSHLGAQLVAHPGRNNVADVDIVYYAFKRDKIPNTNPPPWAYVFDA